MNDIFRLDVRHFLNKMGEPEQTRGLLKDGELRFQVCQKVYHMHMISRYKSAESGTGKLRRHVRLVLNRDGIRRINEVNAS